MEDSTAWMINSILLDTYHGSKPGGADVAGKTGTTNLDKTTKTAYKLPGGAVMDAWMITYSPSYSIALWVGYDKILKESSENKWYLTSNIGGNARRTIMNTLSKKIHTKNESFKRPKTVSHIAVEKESFPAQLCSSNTPKDMCISEYFVRGTEPTEKSKRYATLDTPTNGSSEVVGNNVTLRWDGIATPEPINSSYLQEHFKKYYDKHAESYYQKRISYNDNYIGNLIYEVYLKTSAGETKVGTTSGTSYVYTLPANGSYTFIIKASYSIFTAARSSGLTINVTGGITPPVVPNTDTNTDTDAGI
jgi:membrane peptidoglycan carboxypeptidase